MHVTGVITAAGRSSRMAPDHKLIMDIHGKTMIQRSLDSLLPFCDKIIIVTGTNHNDIQSGIQSHPKIRLIKNPNPSEGMFSSVKTGLNHGLSGPVLYLPGDCPFTPHELIRKMLKENGDVVAAAYKGKHGHPLLLSEKAVQEILKNDDLLNLKQYLQTKTVVCVNSQSDIVLWDIDTPSDLHKARIYFEKIEGDLPYGEDQATL